MEEVADPHDVQMQHLVTRQKPSTRVGQPSVIPSSPQQENDKEVREWAEQWGVGVCLPQVTWPSTSCAPPEPTTARRIKAIHNFLEGTALGTDRYHPRILLRLNPAFLDTLIKVFILCETLGVWPSAITDDLIALLPKPAGGRRPISPRWLGSGSDYGPTSSVSGSNGMIGPSSSRTAAKVQMLPSGSKRLHSKRLLLLTGWRQPLRSTSSKLLSGFGMMSCCRRPCVGNILFGYFAPRLRHTVWVCAFLFAGCSLRLCGHDGISPLCRSRSGRSYGVFFCACSMALCVCSSRDVNGNC